MVKSFIKCFSNLIILIDRAWIKYVKRPLYKSCLGYCGKNVDVRWRHSPGSLSRIYLYDDTNIYQDFKFISVTGKFIMNKKSGAAAGLTVITGNHQRVKGKWLKDISGNHNEDVEQDVIVEDDVWIGANVTLMPGVRIGRGATIGSGSVCRKSIPPYSIVMGNPAKVVGFSFLPRQIIEHELSLYPEEDRLPLELLESNYVTFFKNRVKTIREFSSL